MEFFSVINFWQMPQYQKSQQHIKCDGLLGKFDDVFQFLACNICIHFAILQFSPLNKNTLIFFSNSQLTNSEYTFCLSFLTLLYTRSSTGCERMKNSRQRWRRLLLLTSCPYSHSAVQCFSTENWKYSDKKEQVAP